MAHARDVPPPPAAGAPPRRHPLDWIADRPRGEAALAVLGAWLAFTAALLAGGEVEDLASLAIAAASGAALVFLGLAAASRCRPLPRSSNARRGRLALLSVAAGAGLGLANLAANRLIAAADPALRALMGERVEAVDPLVALAAAPVVEEIAVRLFLMSAIAWAVSRFTGRTGLAFAVALVGSSLGFALLHLDRPVPDDPTLASFYLAALVAKYTLAGLPLGWIFWRWGLPYALLAHVAANAAHLVVQSGLF
jgi:membrane protease YdiL (CAAX protease family)